MRRSGIVLLLAGLCAGALSVGVPSTSRADTETIDVLQYLVNTQPGSLDGTHAFSQTVDGRNFYNVKWAGDSYENYEYDDHFVYLREDHHGAGTDRSYTFSDGKWMKRHMRIGERITAHDNFIQNYTVTTGPCTPRDSGYFPYSNTLLSRHPDYDLGGTLGRQDVIVLQYDYRVGGGHEYERMYYARDRGMVKWELYRDDKVIQTSSFNEVSEKAPTPPDLASACRDTPAPRTVPPLPATDDAFLTDVLYGCVLQHRPDEAGMEFWRSRLRDGTLQVSAAYREFYKAQGDRLSHEEFVKTAYRCMLFREVAPAEAADLAARIKNGSLTRSGLVDTILRSSEFRARVLPRVQLINLDAPEFPYDRAVFLSTLYSCVLNTTEPDSAGYDFWWNHLEAGRITPKELYLEFFERQSTSVVDDDRFARKLFGCILFRPIDPPSADSVLARLRDGATRTQLVRSVLDSPEFTGRVLPRLSALK